MAVNDQEGEKRFEEDLARMKEKIQNIRESHDEDDFAIDADQLMKEKKKAHKRLAELRKLSMNIHPTDPNNEFDSVPAYIRRNMKLDDNPPKDKQAIHLSLDDQEPQIIIKAAGSYPLANFLSLYFPLNEFDEEEITEIISLLSDLYKSVGGDALEIKSIKTFEFVNQLSPEFV